VSFKVRFNSNSSFKATFTPQADMKAKFGEFIEIPIAEYYDGDYSITPTGYEQIIPIQGKTGRHDITVGAIPNNYGLITWNGATLTVS